jgi:putative membrane protein
MIFLLIIAGIYGGIGFFLLNLFTETIFITGFVLLFFIMVLIHGYKTLGPREILFFFLIAYSVAMLYEYTDGLGFGELVHCKPYYSNILGPKFLGKIPYVIPLVWTISFYCAFTMTNIIFNRLKTTRESTETISRYWFVKIIGMGIVSGLMMASWDLICDPVMVKIGAWSWSYSGSYYGIPLWNYEGWVEIPAVIFFIFSLYMYKIKKNQIYISGDKQSQYTLLVVLLYIALLVIYIMYAIYLEVSYSIPWAALTMGSIAALTIVCFYRSLSK